MTPSTAGKFRLALLFLGCGLLRAGAAPAPGGVPPERLAVLTRGLNLGHWFSAEPYDHQRLENWIAPEEFAALAHAGVRHVRFPIEFEMFFDPDHPTVPKPAYLADLDRALNHILGAGLAVVVDFHARKDTKENFAHDDALVAKYAALWGALAAHLATRDPNRVFLETMNEPLGQAEMPLERWLAIQTKFLAAMRAAAPANTIIVKANNYDAINQLVKTKPLADPDVVYSIHFYDPVFTRQGATWAGGRFLHIVGVVYPPDAANKAAVASRVPDARSRALVLGYNGTRQELGERLAKAAAWARRYGVHLYCGEFGVYEKDAPRDSRLRWIHDVRHWCEADGIDWCMWDYCGGFGVVRGDAPGQRPLDNACLEALGLR